MSGVVTDATTHQPIGGVVVSLSLDPKVMGMVRPGPLQRQMTDAKGRFLFRNLPASDGFLIKTNKPGYFDGAYGKKATSADVSRLVLADGQWLPSADIEMWHPGAITGTVRDEHGDPMVGAFVRVWRQIFVAGSPQLAAGPLTTTDDRGMYRIADLAPGSFLVVVPSVQMAVPVTTPASVLARSGGQSGMDAGIEIDSDSRLMVGGYVTPPAPKGSQLMLYPVAFYPGVPTATRATPITLDYSQDRGGVDFRLEPVPGWRLSGTVDGPAEVISKLTLRLMPAGSEDMGIGSEAATALIGHDGRFTFLGVPSGDYTIDARGTLTEFESDAGMARYLFPAPPGRTNSSGSSMTVPSGPAGTGFTTSTSDVGDAWWGRQRVALEGHDVADVLVSMHQTVSVSGVSVFEDEANATAAVPYVFLLLEPASGSASLGNPRNGIRPNENSRAFQMDGLMPGEYLLRARASDAWTVKSIVSDGHDYTRTPFDASGGRSFTNVVVTFTDKLITLAGNVRNAQHPSDTSGAVIVFPAERNEWTHYGFSPTRIKAAMTSNTGSYRVSGLPAGDYFVIAVDESRFNAWQDPAFLESAAKLATRVSLAWADSKTVDLAIVTIR
jgi:hypothetical protein